MHIECHYTIWKINKLAFFNFESFIGHAKVIKKVYY